MHALHVGERGYQRDGLRHHRSRIDLANGFGIGRQFQRHIPVGESVRGPDGHHQTGFGRQCGRAPGIFEDNRGGWDVVLDEWTDDRRFLNCHSRAVSSLMGLPLQGHNDGDRDQNECQERD